MAPPVSTGNRDIPPGRGTGRRRRGSRILLAVSLAGGILGSLLAGPRISDFLLDIAGVSSAGARIGGKIVAVVILLPAGFYLVERIFLSRTPRGDGNR